MLELIVAIAILTILVGMVAQIVQMTSKAHQKEVILSRMDRTLGKTIDLLKRSVRRSTIAENQYNLPAGYPGTTTDLAIVVKTTHGHDDYTQADSVIINYSERDASDATGALYTDRQIMYLYDGTKKEIRIAVKESGADTFANEEVIAENITNAWFMYDESVLRFQFTIDLNIAGGDEEWKKKVVTDAAVLRTGLNNIRR